MSDVYRFLRPAWMIHVYLAASLLFGAACVLYLLNGNWIFGFAWLVFGMVWFQRWTWVKANPVFEISEQAIVAVFGPGRKREIPLREISGVVREEERLLVALHDGSEIALATGRLMGSETDRDARLSALQQFLSRFVSEAPPDDSDEETFESDG